MIVDTSDESRANYLSVPAISSMQQFILRQNSNNNNKDNNPPPPPCHIIDL